MTANRLNKIVSLVVLAWSLLIFSQNASASQSKAQLYLPWPMLNTKLNNVLKGSNSSFSTNVPSQTIDAAGINWNITNTEYSASTTNASLRTNGSQATFAANNTSVQVNVEKIAVDQYIDQNENGVIVHIHLVADCGPITFTQPNATAAASFNIDWSSGSPILTLTGSSLSWAQNSWIVSDFTCNGPAGLPQILKDQILSRLQNADDFRPYLTEFIIQHAQTMVDNTLGNIRQPFTVNTGSSRQTFRVGNLYDLPQGVIADLTVSDSPNAPLLPPMTLPTSATLKSLSTATPSLIAEKDLMEQIIRDELNAQTNEYHNDLQNNPAFHQLMHDRLKQVFGWIDLIHYDTDSPFPLTIYKPDFQGFTVLANGNLQTTVALKGIVQSYRQNQWWNWLDIGGTTSADITLKVNAGKISYNTTLIPTTATINYTDEYKKGVGKDADDAPPAQRIIDALAGSQPALSGSFVFPTISIGDTGNYQLIAIKWLTPEKFVLSFREL